MRTHYSESDWRPQREIAFTPLSSREILEGFTRFPDKPVWTPHSHCVSTVEHETELQSLKSLHARELEDQKRAIVSSFEDRMKEFEDTCIAQYQDKVKALQASHVSNADVLQLEAKLDACSLSEQIIKRKCEGKLARAEIVIQEFRLKLEREQMRVAELTLELERKTKEVAETNNAISGSETTGYNFSRLEAGFQRADKSFFEDRAADTDLKTHLKALQRDNELLATERLALQQSLHAAESTIKQLKASSQPAVQKLQGDTEPKRTDHIHELRCFYEKTIMGLSDELMQWKEKSLTLATKMYASLKEVKAEVKTLREDAVETKEAMKKELKTAVENHREVKTPKRSGSTTAICGKTWCSAKAREVTVGKKKQ